MFNDKPKEHEQLKVVFTRHIIYISDFRVSSQTPHPLNPSKLQKNLQLKNSFLKGT